MRCHYCDRSADFEVESGGVIVGLCEQHLRERVETLADDEAAAMLREAFDGDES